MDIAARLAALQAELERLDAESAARRAPLEAEARELIEQQVAELHRWLGLSAAVLKRVMKATRGLTIAPEHDTLNAMDAIAETHASRISRARITKGNKKHPFVKAFTERGQKVHEAAKAIGYPRTSVQSWYSGARPIPRAAVEIIQKLYGVPASAWPRITD